MQSSCATSKPALLKQKIYVNYLINYLRQIILFGGVHVQARDHDPSVTTDGSTVAPIPQFLLVVFISADGRLTDYNNLML